MLKEEDFVWMSTERNVIEDKVVTDYWFKVFGDSADELSSRYMEQSMVDICEVVYTDEDGGLVGVKRRFPGNCYTSKVNNKELCAILTKKIRYQYMKDRSFVKLIPITKSYGTCKTEEVVLFNSNHISMEDALATVKSDLYNPNVMCLPKNQWVELFCDGIDEI